MRVYYSVQLIEFITEPMGNAIPAGPVINSVSVWCAKCLGNKQIHTQTTRERSTLRRKNGKRKELEKERERKRLRQHEIIEYEFFYA